MVTEAEVLKFLTEDRLYFFYDNFFTKDMHVDIGGDISGGPGPGGNAVYTLPFDKEMVTGTIIPGIAGFIYNQLLWNPRYGTLMTKARVDNTASQFTFFGFKEWFDLPTFTMTQSHAGFMIKNGKIYISAGDGALPAAHQWRQEILGWDLTNWLEFKIVGSSGGTEFWMRSLPITWDYFGSTEELRMTREWTMVGKLTTVIPANQVHFIYFHIQTAESKSKTLSLQHVLYSERYAD
jgi:hypothetical protein